MSDCRLHTPVPQEIADALKGLTREHLEQVIARLFAHRFLLPGDLDLAIREARQQWHWRRWDQAMDEFRGLIQGPDGEHPKDRLIRYQRSDAVWRQGERHAAAADRLWPHHQPRAQATP